VLEHCAVALLSLFGTSMTKKAYLNLEYGVKNMVFANDTKLYSVDNNGVVG